MDPKKWFRSFRSALPRLEPESSFVVTVTDDGISCTNPDGRVSSISWNELNEVVLETTDEGPDLPDVFCLLIGFDQTVVVPQGATGEEALLKRMQRLSGFDNNAFIAAMASTGNAKFCCWKRTDL